MKNFEKYEKELLEIAKTNNYPSVSKKDNKPHKCADMSCNDCLLDSNTYGCRNMLIQWLYEEHRELIKLSHLEYELLKYYIKHGYRYIARDSDKVLFAYDTKPGESSYQWEATGRIKRINFDDLFSFIKWEDEKPYKIQDILDNCVVVKKMNR